MILNYEIIILIGIYDTYIDEEQLQICDKTICKIADDLKPKAYTSREFIKEIGRYLKTNSKKKNSLIETAYNNNIPIFLPSIYRFERRFWLGNAPRKKIQIIT